VENVGIGENSSTSEFLSTLVKCIICHTNRRRKRAVDSDDVFEDTPLTYDSNYDPDYLPPVSLAKPYV
jgi:hypothetical protein